MTMPILLIAMRDVGFIIILSTFLETEINTLLSHGCKYRQDTDLRM